MGKWGGERRVSGCEVESGKVWGEDSEAMRVHRSKDNGL